MESNSFINQATKKKSNYINSVQYELYLILKLVVVLIKYIYKKWIKLLINRIENHAYTSALKRASKTLEIVLYVLKKNIPIISDKALNERNYGSLTGMNKDDARNKWGDEQVKLWRRSYDIAPENGESLKDTCNRTIPYFKKNILPKLHDGENVIITAHGNSLRSIIMHVEGLSEEAIVNVEITTGIPIVYEYENKKVIKKTELFVKRY